MGVDKLKNSNYSCQQNTNDALQTNKIKLYM